MRVLGGSNSALVVALQRCGRPCVATSSAPQPMNTAVNTADPVNTAWRDQRLPARNGASTKRHDRCPSSNNSAASPPKTQAGGSLALLSRAKAIKGWCHK